MGGRIPCLPWMWMPPRVLCQGLLFARFAKHRARYPLGEQEATAGSKGPEMPSLVSLRYYVDAGHYRPSILVGSLLAIELMLMRTTVLEPPVPPRPWRSSRPLTGAGEFLLRVDEC